MADDEQSEQPAEGQRAKDITNSEAPIWFQIGASLFVFGIPSLIAGVLAGYQFGVIIGIIVFIVAVALNGYFGGDNCMPLLIAFILALILFPVFNQARRQAQKKQQATSAGTVPSGQKAP